MLMDYKELVQNRQSTRAFLNEEVELETVKEILEEATTAPSAGNIQPWRFIIIGAQDIKFQLTQASSGQRFIAQAPWVIAVIARCDESASVYGERGRNLYCIQDTAALIMLVLLSATERELGTCWVGAFDEDRVDQILDVKPGERVVALVPIGKPARTPDGETSRKPIETLLEVLE